MTIPILIGKFVVVNRIKIRNILLVLAIFIPLISTTIAELVDRDDLYELCEKAAEEGENDARETGWDEDEVKEYLVFSPFKLLSTKIPRLTIILAGNFMPHYSQDVLTPPPEFS